MAASSDAPVKPASTTIDDRARAESDVVALIGDAAKAKVVVDQVVALADFYGVNQRTVLVLTKGMLRAGVDVDDLPQMTSGLVDVGTMASWSDAHGLIAVYKRAHDRGYVSSADLTSIASILPAPVLLDAIADARATPGAGADRRAAVERDVLLARVKPREFLAGMLLAIVKRYGFSELGAAALAAKAKR